MITGTLTSSPDYKEIEEKYREEYAKKHPEYAAVMKKGQAIEKAYEASKTKRMAEWEKEHPKPELNPFGTLGTMRIYEKKLKEWSEERQKAIEEFESNYKENNPNYANLKEAEHD